MLASMKHESFYVTGTWVDETMGIYLGWSAAENCFACKMPVYSEDRKTILVFSGEEFPDAGAARRLKEHGHVFKANTAEYLVHLYEDDPGFPVSLNGRFHGLVVDTARRCAALFNDRYGMHRIYYHESRKGFYFAGEAKALLSVHPHLRSLDLRSLGEFLACGCVLENRTLFKGIQVLPCAAKWTFENGGVAHKGSYFQPREWEEQPQADPQTYYRELRTVFSENLSRYFIAGQPIGMSLTGGLDTRMIMAWRKPAAGTLPCYTFGSMFHDCHDVVLARKVAGLCQQPHSVIRVNGDFLQRFPRYAERAVYLTDGCVDVGRSADLYVNEITRGIAPVRMTGNYGGEVMRRVRAFKPIPPNSDLFCAELGNNVRQAGQTYAELIKGHPLSFAVFKQAPWHHYGLLALEETQLSLRSPYLDNDFVRTVFRAPESACTSNDVCLGLIGDADATLRGIRTDRGLGGTGLRWATTRLLLELQFKAEYACDYGMPQWAAPIDSLVSGLQPSRLFLGRHKFAHFRIWYRDYLSAYVKDVLLDPAALARPHLNRQQVEAVVKGHLSGTQNRTLEIHKLLTVELIYRSLLESWAN